ncbi:MAG: hypothetical protein HY917_05755 [Candidatus Diapherotrites archaeon]|nr:hypothetical protein [Candidatus Diapherotrites archaeon]
MIAMAATSMTVSREEFLFLKKKAAFADDVLFQLESSLQDIVKGRIKKAVH